MARKNWRRRAPGSTKGGKPPRPDARAVGVNAGRHTLHVPIPGVVELVDFILPFPTVRPLHAKGRHGH